jgi:hypothetical protein
MKEGYGRLDRKIGFKLKNSRQHPGDFGGLLYLFYHVSQLKNSF